MIDAHCHLADPRLESVLEEQLKEARSFGITQWIQGGISPLDWQRQLTLKEKLGTSVITSFGLHPWWVAENSPETVEKGLVTLENEILKADALGELGIDKHPKRFPEKTLSLQLQTFEKQILIAKKYDKPMVLHIVQSHPEAIQLLKKHSPHPASGIIHSFSGSEEIAKEYIALGFLLSISGVISRLGYSDIKKALRTLPLDKIVIETDAPSQAPVFEKGGINRLCNLIGIAETLASLVGTDKEKILAQSSENLKKLFRLKDEPTHPNDRSGVRNL